MGNRQVLFEAGTLDIYMNNLRFADDVLLICESFNHIQQMLADLEEAARTVGLTLHPKKTKILTNLKTRKGENGRKSCENR